MSAYGYSASGALSASGVLTDSSAALSASGVLSASGALSAAPASAVLSAAPVAGLAAGSAYVAGSNRAPVLAPEQHKLNVDPNPLLVRKKPAERVQYVQNVSLKFLKPPPAPKPGDILIEQEQDVQVPPAPALLVRQKPAQPIKPAPAVFRELPPRAPAPIPPKHITIPGKVLPPPPRKVITERLPQMPPMPQDIIIERWLGYDRRTRNVLFRPAAPIVPLPAPKNVLIQWESPDADIRQDLHFLGVEVVDPAAYAATYGASLVGAAQLPAEAGKFQVPAGQRLAVDSNPDETPLLTGEVQALRLINLGCHGLNEYAPQL